MEQKIKVKKSDAGSSKARKYVYSDKLKFLSKPINERQTPDSLSVDNMEESQDTTVEQNRDDMNNFSQKTPFLVCNHHIFLLKHTNITYLIATAIIYTG
jgi:hypothetical protein